jgi:hypothetical protein
MTPLDMTHWREELKAWRPDSELCREIFSKENMNRRDKQITIDQLILFIETLLSNAELKRALVERHLYFARTDLVEDDPRFPSWTDQPLSDFTDWFSLKTHTLPNTLYYIGFCVFVAADAAVGELADLRQTSVFEHIKDKYPPIYLCNITGIA